MIGIWEWCLLPAVWTHSHTNWHSNLFKQQPLASQPGRQREQRSEERLKEKRRRAQTDTEVCLLLQTPPAEAHWLVPLAPPSLIGCDLALPSAAQPGRRGGHHHNLTGWYPQAHAEKLHENHLHPAVRPYCSSIQSKSLYLLSYNKLNDTFTFFLKFYPKSIIICSNGYSYMFFLL